MAVVLLAGACGDDDTSGTDAGSPTSTTDLVETDLANDGRADTEDSPESAGGPDDDPAEATPDDADGGDAAGGDTAGGSADTEDSLEQRAALAAADIAACSEVEFARAGVEDGDPDRQALIDSAIAVLGAAEDVGLRNAGEALAGDDAPVPDRLADAIERCVSIGYGL